MIKNISILLAINLGASFAAEEGSRIIQQKTHRIHEQGVGAVKTTFTLRDYPKRIKEIKEKLRLSGAEKLVSYEDLPEITISPEYSEKFWISLSRSNNKIDWRKEREKWEKFQNQITYVPMGKHKTCQENHRYIATDGLYDQIAVIGYGGPDKTFLAHVVRKDTSLNSEKISVFEHDVIPVMKKVLGESPSVQLVSSYLSYYDSQNLRHLLGIFQRHNVKVESYDIVDIMIGVEKERSAKSTLDTIVTYDQSYMISIDETSLLPEVRNLISIEKVILQCPTTSVIVDKTTGHVRVSRY